VADSEIFRELEHTADLGIEVQAGSRPEMFRRAAVAIARLMVITEAVRGIESRELWIPGCDDADLMHDLLSRLLQTFMIDNFIWSDVSVDEGPGGLKIALHGERFDPARHEFRREIKAVTYHELSIRNAGGRWIARVIFDV
jgi:SHS2 domain-containing protein